MTEQQAQEIARPFEANEENKTIIVTSDHGVFLNTPLEIVEEFANRKKPSLKVFIIRSSEDQLGEQPEADQLGEQPEADQLGEQPEADQIDPPKKKRSNGI